MQASFAGATEADPGFIPLNDACLTGAATDSSAPQTGSKLAGCQKSKNSPALGVTPGYLQLTDSTNDRTGGLLYNRPVAGNGGLYVAFDQYQYGGNGADGISFFLVDGTTELTTSGAYGGSLGYAQKTKEHSPRNSPGVSGAYLGIGLDVYGHFAQDNEGRGTGCQDKTDQKVPNAVTLRGGGEGLNGYCWIKTAKMPEGTSLKADTLDKSKRHVEILLSQVYGDNLKPWVSVYVDGELLIREQMPTDAPQTWKFGFAGSTGSNNDVHLINNLEAWSFAPLDPLNIVKTVKEKKDFYQVGDVINYQLVVNNSGYYGLRDIEVKDDTLTIDCPTTELGAAGTPTSSMECSASYTVTKDDVRNFDQFTNTAKATAVDATLSETEYTSNEAVASVNLKAADHMTLTKFVQSAPKKAAVGDEVSYGFKVTNTGDTKFSNLRITDPKVDSVSCPKSDLDFDEEITCTARYTVTQEDVDAGIIENVASASAVPNNEDRWFETPETDPVTVNAIDPVSTLKLTKKAELRDVDGNGQADRDDKLSYTFEVENSGNVTINEIKVTDPKVKNLKCPQTKLAPGAQMTCTSDEYNISQADVDAGGVANSATVTGKSPKGVTVTTVAMITTDTRFEPAIDAVLEQIHVDDDQNGTGDAGETINYVTKVTNSGNLTLSDLKVWDPKLGKFTCDLAILAPGQTAKCTTSPYRISKEDSLRGSTKVKINIEAKDPQGKPLAVTLDGKVDVKRPLVLPKTGAEAPTALALLAILGMSGSALLCRGSRKD